VLNNYGGAYQDFDVLWTSRVPEFLLEYPTVLSLEWMPNFFPFLDVVNNGVILTQAG
jgi:hypothetical protein